MNKYPPHVFLESDSIVDWEHPKIRALAASLLGADVETTARQCFEWVRDHIEHSMDFDRKEMTLAASEVLDKGTGLCTAKSHLLVALWRAHEIPSGFCYQRLTLEGDCAPYCTHGFVAVWLEGIGWYRCDARGNTRPGIRCVFSPGQENLAYTVTHPGEIDYGAVWPRPWPALVAAMRELSSIPVYKVCPIDAKPPISAQGDEAFVVIGSLGNAASVVKVS